jgi:hypothetical protein
MSILIPYNADAVSDSQIIDAPGASPGFSYRLPTVAVTPGTALRLNSGQLEFGDPPPVADMPRTEDQLAFLRGHFARQCDIWNKHARLFVERYFEFVERQVAGATSEIAELLSPFGTLYRPDQCTFAALRPLPRAHFDAPDAEHPVPPGALLRAEIGFWAASGGVAIEPVGSNTRRPADAARRARFEAAGIRVVEMPHALLKSGDAAAFDRALPDEFHHFWRDTALPSGPFKAVAALGSLPA